MDSKKLIISTFLILMFLVPIALLGATSVQYEKDQQRKAETLLSLLDQVKRSVEEAFSGIKMDGKKVPQEAENEYYEGTSMAKEAAAFFGRGNYCEASTRTVEALQKFGDALVILEETMPEKPTVTEVEAEKAIILKSDINRTYRYTERLEDLAIRGEMSGYDTTSIKDAINNARRYLTNALETLELGNINDASKYLASSKALLEQSVKDLSRLAIDVKVTKTMEFLVKTENRLSLLRDNITALSNELPQEVKDASLLALNRAEISLQQAKEFMTEGMIDETVDELGKVKESEEELRQYLEAATATVENVEKDQDSS